MGETCSACNNQKTNISEELVSNVHEIPDKAVSPQK